MMADQLMLKFLLAACLAVAVLAKPLDQLYRNEKYVLYTDAQSESDSMEQHTLFVEGQRAMIFRVRACTRANLRLAAIIGHDSVTTYLGIGHKGNTKTYLKRSGVEVATADTPDILHCNEMRAFWVSWAYGYIRVGRGSALGVGMILNVPKTGELNHDVTTISLNTPAGVAGVWEVDDDQFYSLVASPIAIGNSPYPAYTWRSVLHAPGNFMYFAVKACDDVSIYLGESFGSAEYTIRIANGGHNEIYKGSVRIAYDTATNLLDCAQPRTFWVSWWMGRITLGKGFIKYQNTLLEATDTGVGDIYALGFAAGPNSKATFDLTASIDEVYTFQTKPPSDTIQQWMHVAESRFVAFSVQACSQVQVVFSDTLGTASANAVKLQLHWEGNNINKLVSGGNTLAQNATDILDCDSLTTIWASFANNAFRVGKASVKGIETFLAASTNLDIRMTGIGFSSGEEASWAVGTIEPGLLRLVTEKNTEGNYTTWASGTKKYYKEFKMNLCSGAALINLTPCLGCQTMGSTGSYHIEITNNGVKIIHRQGGSESDLKTISDPDVAKCGTLRSFFVSWYEGVPIFGKGDLTSGDTLIEMDESLPYHVNAIALTSEDKCTWEMDMETGEQLSFQKKDGSTRYNWVKVSPRLTWQRFWLTASNVEFILASTYGDSTKGYKFTFNSGVISFYKNMAQLATKTGVTLDKYQRLLMVVSWADGVITLGPETGAEKYINYKDSSPLTVNGFGILPIGDSSEVRMPHTFASEMTFTTSPTQDLIENWMELTHHDTLVFTIKGSSSAQIVLAPFLYHDLVNNCYRLIIGDSSNTVTSIKVANYVAVTVPTPDILSASEERNFWIQWYHGEIVLGHGKHVGNDVIISYYDPSPAPITVAAFTGSENMITWNVGLVPYGNLEGLDELPSPGGGGGLSGGQVAGIVIGVLLLVGLIGGFVYLYKFGKMQSFMGSMPSPSMPSMGRGANSPQQFNNPLSYPDTNSVPNGQQSSA